MAKQVIKVSTTWCGPCKALKPVWEQIKTALKDDSRVEFKEFDPDNDSDEGFCIQHKINTVPTILFMENGKEVKRLVGFQQNLQESINQWLE